METNAPNLKERKEKMIALMTYMQDVASGNPAPTPLDLTTVTHLLLVHSKYPHQEKAIDSLFLRGMSQEAMLNTLKAHGITHMTMVLAGYVKILFNAQLLIEENK